MKHSNNLPLILCSLVTLMVVCVLLTAGCLPKLKPVALVTKTLPSLGMIQLTGRYSYESGHPQLMRPEDIVKIEGGRSGTTVWLSSSNGGELTFVHVYERPATIAKLITKLKEEQQ